MKTLMFGLILLATFPSAFAQECDGGYRCGQEYHDKPHRSPQPIQQPLVTERVMGSCGDYLPLNQSYQARPVGVSCGSGAGPVKNREPLPVPEAVMERWDILSRSGRADAQEEMQKVRQQEQKWSGQISIPMQEHWTFTQIVGDYADQCGFESFSTTCYKDREEQYTYTWQTDICTRYEEYDDAPSSSFGGGSGGSSSSPYSSGSPSRSSGGSRENRQDHRNDSRGSWGSSLDEEYKPHNPSEIKTDRRPAARRCVSWGKQNHSERRWRPASRLAYSCVKQRPKWCIWPTTARGSRACKSHVANYSVNFEKDPQWQPGFVDQKDPARRSYIEILPNRWDLLLGESEKVALSIGGSPVVSPSISIQNGLPDRDQPWNEYSFKFQPTSVTCAFNMAPNFNIGVITHGRILQAAPNPLRVPKDALKFNLEQNNRPSTLELNDNGRGTRLKAAQNARNLGRNQGADPLYKKGDKDRAGTSASGGYWEETRFKIQLFRRDVKGREVRVTVKPESYSYDQVDVFDDAVTISLEGKDGTDRFYRPGGPMEFIFGRLYRAFNIELTPGQEYFIRVRVVSRGLPFYDSGCNGGAAVCKGEEGTEDAYSEPIDIPFTADPSVDKRSWFKKFRDWQERRLWL